ncbi:unnamed protein product, partial [Staurois parvus]
MQGPGRPDIVNVGSWETRYSECKSRNLGAGMVGTQVYKSRNSGAGMV